MKYSLLLICLFASTLFAKPYLSEYHGQGIVVIFQGEIKQEDEGQVRRLQTLYLESLVLRPDRLYQYRTELARLGVKVTESDDDPFIPSEQATPYFPTTSPPSKEN